ncbi:MAG: hypothetical protein F6K11_15625 [Leptolyngbya sp. SIO3F4]|nr:hypothetical protein [Leptolyngbya sp. SIO3F4]
MEAIDSKNEKAILIRKKLKSLLLNDHLDNQWADLLVGAVTDIIEGDYTDLNVLMHCAMAICHFRTLLEKSLDKYENSNISAAFTLVYTCFEEYLDKLTQRENKVVLTALLNTKSLTKTLV